MMNAKTTDETREAQIRAAQKEERSPRPNWKDEETEMSKATVRLDDRKEFDELIVENVMVHIERMDRKAFWIGIYPKDGPGWMVRTGVVRDKWYFNVEEDATNGRLHRIEVPVWRRK